MSGRPASSVDDISCRISGNSINETLREQNIIAGLMKTKLWLRKNTPTWMHSLWRQVWPWNKL